MKSDVWGNKECSTNGSEFSENESHDDSQEVSQFDTNPLKGILKRKSNFKNIKNNKTLKWEIEGNLNKLKIFNYLDPPMHITSEPLNISVSFYNDNSSNTDTSKFKHEEIKQEQTIQFNQNNFTKRIEINLNTDSHDKFQEDDE